MKTTVKHVIFRIIITIAVFILGYTIGVYGNLGFAIQKEIDTIEILSVLATVLAAYWVSQVLEHNKQNKRSEKDLLIRRIDGLITLLETAHHKVVRDDLTYQEAARQLKSFAVSTSSIFKLAQTCEILVPEEEKSKLNKKTRNLKNLMTQTPIFSETHQPLTRPHIEVRNNVLIYSPERKVVIDAKFDELKDLMLLLQIMINKG